MFKLRDKIKYSKGLTLIELMVVISIFLVITTIVIFNYEGFSSTVSLQNLTDDIALSIRKAQSFAIGARGVTGNFSNSYGVHFSNTTTVPSSNLEASSKSFLMFSTTSPSKGYTVASGKCSDGTNSCLESFGIVTEDIIKDIKLNDGEVSFTEGSYLDIIFTRPNPRATFCYRVSSVSSTCDAVSSSISRATIVVSNGNPDNEKIKNISIQNTGQISIQ